MATIEGILTKGESDGYSYGTMNKTGVYIFLEANGFYNPEIGGASFNAQGRHHKWILPLREDSFVTPLDQQTYFQPIEELFKEVSSVIQGLGANWISGIADMVVKFQDLFGTRLFNSDLHAQAWRQAVPSSMSLKLDFNYGMLDVWNSKIEVVQPLLIIKRTALPKSDSAAHSTFYAPGPTALSVYTDFGKNIFQTIINQGKAQAQTAAAATNPAYRTQGAGTAIAGAMNTAYDGARDAGTALIDASTKAAASDASAESKRGYWALSFVAYNQKTNTTRTLYQSPRMICKESTISFGGQLDESLCPISGSATLSLSSQSPTDSEDYNLINVWST